MPDSRTFDGTLVTVPFATGNLQSVVVDQYSQLLDEHDVEDVVVVTGSPTSAGTFRELLTDAVPGAGTPRVTSLVVQATDVMNWTDDRAILSDAMRRELVHRFLADRDWECDYYRRAADQPSFHGDVARLMETVAWQDTSPDETEELVEVAEAVDEFHSWLDDHDHVERGQLVSEAVSILEDPGEGDEVVDAEAVLAVEFEEFFPVDRRYLGALADDRDLVCVAETDASVRRTWVEPGPIADHVSFTIKRAFDGDQPGTRPAATAAYLARGEVHDDPGSGQTNVVATAGPDEQIERVADEIERLSDREGWAYADIAVALKRSGEGVPETMQALRESGVPTESATVVGFGDDPAVRELLRVVHYLAAGAHEDTEGTDDEAHEYAEDPDEAYEHTGDTNDEDGRRPGFLHDDPMADESLLDDVAGMDGIAAPLRRWATESGLKDRIATETAPLDARTQFGNVRRVFGMAEFIEETAFVESTWTSLAEMLERAHEHAPRRNQTSAIEHDGGVRVDHLQALKNGSFRAVFVLDVVDAEYPGDLGLTRLFPTERVVGMPDYPGVTDVEEADVAATFATDSTASERPVRRYHAEHARRRLATGAAAATDRLYLCLYEHSDTALEERVQPSRFLTDAYRTLPWLRAVDESTVESERAAEEYLLSRVDRALREVRRARSHDVTISLDDVEADLAEVQRLLANSGERGERLREALRARVDFAAGRVRRG